MSDGENVVMTWTRDLVPAPPDSQVLYLTLQDDRLWVVYNVYPITAPYNCTLQNVHLSQE